MRRSATGLAALVLLLVGAGAQPASTPWLLPGGNPAYPAIVGQVEFVRPAKDGFQIQMRMDLQPTRGSQEAALPMADMKVRLVFPIGRNFFRVPLGTVRRVSPDGRLAVAMADQRYLDKPVVDFSDGRQYVVADFFCVGSFVSISSEPF